MTIAEWTVPWLVGLTLIASPGPQEGSFPEGTYALHAEGFGPVRVGMTVSEAERLLDDSLVPDEPVPSPGPDAAEYEACHYVTPRRLPGVAFVIASGRIARVDVFAEPYRTLEGAGIGTPEATLHRLYPVAASEPHPYADFAHAVLVAGDAGNGLAFETDGQTVTALRSGTIEAVSTIEGCP